MLDSSAMSTTIVERILSEYNARKATREAILGKGSGQAPPAPAAPPAAPRPAAENDILARFRNECIPVIGRAVSTEVAAALEKVRGDLLGCLQRELSRSAAPAPRAFLADEVELDSRDTDLDLPTEEVNRQLDQVFAVMEAQGPPAPDARSRAQRPARPAIPEPLDGSEQPTEDLAADADSAFEAAVEAPALERREDLRLPPPEPLRRGSDPRPPSGREGAAPVRPVPGDERVLDEFREAVIPGIADGLSKVLAEVEKGQEAISQQVAQLAERVTGLESRSSRPAGKTGGEGEARRPAASGGREAEAGGVHPALFGHLEEMERRIIERIDGLVLALGVERSV